MHASDLYIAAVASELPTRLSAADAIEAGWCDQRVHQQTGIESVAVSEAAAPAQLAAAAARTALDRAGTPAEAVRIVLHADVWYQGQDLWAPASYVQRVAVGNRCPAVEIRQLSNGGMAMIDLAAHVLHGAAAGSAALLTTGDVFHLPGFDRWRSDPGTVYGDGGTAAVLSVDSGFAAVRSIAVVSDPDLEGLHRGSDPFGPVPFSVRQPLDLDALKRAHLAGRGVGGSVSRMIAGQHEATERALKDAGLTLGDIDRFVLPHFGLRRLQAGYLQRWDIEESVTTWPWARTVGHLGAGDQFAGLEYLALSGQLRPGQHCLLVGVGAGFTWSATVVQIVDRPDWGAKSDWGAQPDRGAQ